MLTDVLVTVTVYNRNNYRKTVINNVEKKTIEGMCELLWNNPSVQRVNYILIGLI